MCFNIRGPSVSKRPRAILAPPRHIFFGWRSPVYSPPSPAWLRRPQPQRSRTRLAAAVLHEGSWHRYSVHHESHFPSVVRAGIALMIAALSSVMMGRSARRTAAGRRRTAPDMVWNEKEKEGVPAARRRIHTLVRKRSRVELYVLLLVHTHLGNLLGCMQGSRPLHPLTHTHAPIDSQEQ